MAAIRYARPRLITAADKRYRAHVEQYLLQRQNQRAIRPPSQRDLFGGQAEEALRTWLAQQYTLAETRILEYEEQRGKRALIKYRELDALVLENARSAWVFEIKASRRFTASLNRAVRQLRETRAILRLLYRNVYATILLVDTRTPTEDAEAEAETEAEAVTETDTPATPPQGSGEEPAEQPHVLQVSSLEACQVDGDAVTLLCFSVDDIIALAGAENLSLAWDADEVVEETPPAPIDPTPAYSSEQDADEDDDASDNPLAAALRRAGLSKD